MNPVILNNQEWNDRMQRVRTGLTDRFYALYSSITDGITTDPALMTVPLDDHLVHRGDGVFESFKCVNGNLYNLDAHLQRLEKSATAIGLALPANQEILKPVIVQTVRSGGRREALVRLLISRGTGNMGVNPYECLRPEWYVLVYRPVQGPDRSAGVKVGISRVPMKDPFFAEIKSCNYLPNVLMKKEAVDRGLEFVLSVDPNGSLGEGPTENVAIVTPEGELLSPPPGRVLAGTTVQRVITLAQQLTRNGVLQRAAFEPVPLRQAERAAEILIIGTTPDVLPVIEMEGHPVGTGQPGPVCAALLVALQEDIRRNPACLTPVFSEG